MKHLLLKRVVRAASLTTALMLLTACGVQTPADSSMSVETNSLIGSADEGKEADLSHAALLGNSYIDGFVTYDVLPDTDCFYRIGLTVRSVFTKPMLNREIPVIDELANGKNYDKVFLIFGENELGWTNTQAFYDGYGEVIDAVRERQPDATVYIQSIFYDKVFLIFGENELGWTNTQAFYDGYGEVIDAVRERQPDATVYIQSILPVSAEVSEKNIDCTNNERILEFNDMLKKLSEEKNAIYLDVASVMMDESGNLPEEAATDGIHPGIEYYKKWADYLKKTEEKNAIYLDVASVMMDESGNLPEEAATDGIHPGIEYYKKWADYLKKNAVSQ